MSKHILYQYNDITKEIKELENRIAKLRKRLDVIRSGGNVKDVVKGGAGGQETYHINGYPNADDEETEYLIKKNLRILDQRERELKEKIIELEEWISSLDDSRMRRMITFRFIEGMTWYQVAQAMGTNYSEDSCKKQMERYLKNRVL